MKDIICDEFQNTVSKYLVRHHSILDILSKVQESTARVNRAAVKTVTNCGCLQVHAAKKEIPPNATFDDFAITKVFDNNLEGKICPDCKETLENELGKTLFYLVALCNAMDINLYDVILKENKKLSTLRIFNLT
ncbi:MAG: DUF1573 domain-containing protein [Dehalobacterium sp.]